MPTPAVAITERLLIPVSLLKAALFEPIFTGPLLLALLRGSSNVQGTLLRPFENNVLATNRASRLATAIKALKVLFALGLAGRVNEILNRLALNYFYFKKQGVAWNFEGASGGGKEIVVVTGGCAGFGYHMVKELAGKAKVVVIDVTDLPADLGRLPNVKFFKCDLTSNEQIHKTADEIRSQVGNPSVLINNAGVGTSHTILDTNEEWLEKIFRVNLLSHWTLIREFLPAMLEAQKGHIVTIASGASYITPANLTDYCSTKAGVMALHEGLTQELAHRYTNGECIQTTIVHPMWARTRIIKDWEKALEKAGEFIMEPTVISERVVKQVLSGQSGQLFLPADASRVSAVRGWPNWAAELIRGSIHKATQAG